MKFNILTLFPDLFPGSLGVSIAGEALKNGVWSVNSTDMRKFGVGKHKNVDDTPYGGGAGMVIRPDVLEQYLEGRKEKIIYMSPRGEPFTQKKAQNLAKLDEFSIICGRFEGIDQRVLDHYEIEEISIGDYVLSSGEPAAIVLMDSIIRLLPGVLGNEETLDEESFSNDLLEYPHYTRPAEWKGMEVPEVLTSGDHGKIAKWRKEKSVEITKERRPDLLSKEITKKT